MKGMEEVSVGVSMRDPQTRPDKTTNEHEEMGYGAGR
jgi:hypothetical protein